MSEGLHPEIFAALHLETFVALDIETTGLDYESSDIIEFGAIRFRNGEPGERIEFLLKPSGSIPDHITRLTGITNAHVAQASPFADELERIRQFIGNDPLVVHHVNFDLPFLEYHARKARRNFTGWNYIQKEYHYFPNPKLDTMILARMYLPFLPSFSLGALGDYFRIPRGDTHRALPDAEKAGRLFLELLPITLKTRYEHLSEILEILDPTDEPIKTFFQNLKLLLYSGRVAVPEGIDRRQFTMASHHYNIIGEGDTPDTPARETVPVDENAIRAFFDKNGALSQAFGTFEERPQQATMAQEIARAFNQSAFLIVEAGTGTGKSLAYLLPAIKWAVQNYGESGRVIISTNTKNLQEQLFFKDLPILHSILPERFKAVLLKGRGNYLCLDKWVTVINNMQDRLLPEERARILPLYFWAKETETGDIAENNGFRVERNMGLWSKFIADNTYCPGKPCKFYDRCFLMKARNQARNAHLVLVNHSLLFSDLAADNAILAEYQNVIFDEAHNIEKTATDYLGMEATLWQFRDFLNKLYSKERKETGVLVQLRRHLQHGNLKPSHLDALNRMIEITMDQVSGGWQLVPKFFADLTEFLRQKAPGNARGYSTRHRYSRADQLLEALKTPLEAVKTLFAGLESALNDLVEYFPSLPAESFQNQDQLYRELKSHLAQAGGLCNQLQFLLAAEWDTYVYWFELPRRPESNDTRLYAVPLDIGDILYHKLYSNLRTAVFTSATLAVNKRFDYFINRVGIKHLPEERIHTLRLDSPFQYSEQVFLGVPSYFPDPNSPDFPAAVKTLLTALATRIGRGTLVLFTSYNTLNNVYDSLRDLFAAQRISLLGQGIDGSRHALINRFKSEKDAMLLGTDSFWEGVDVPGEALELVVITKLPFDVPSDPVIQAKSELIQNQGGNPFIEYSVPEAVIRFRQGFGRLIRSRSDYGAVLILDTRVIKKFYGRIFLQSLPLEATILSDEAGLFERLEKWFGK